MKSRRRFAREFLGAADIIQEWTRLLQMGARVKAYDPIAVEACREQRGDLKIRLCDSAIEAATRRSPGGLAGRRIGKLALEDRRRTECDRLFGLHRAGWLRPLRPRKGSAVVCAAAPLNAFRPHPCGPDCCSSERPPIAEIGHILGGASRSWSMR